MSDHEFEKQVQRKMDELKLSPSNAVWTAVEQNIRQHNKRRRFGFWWPLAFVFLGVSGYVMYAVQQPSEGKLPLAKSKAVKGNGVEENNSVKENTAQENTGTKNINETVPSDNTSTLQPSVNKPSNQSTVSGSDKNDNTVAQYTSPAKGSGKKPAHAAQTQQQQSGKQLVTPVAGAHETIAFADVDEYETRLPDAVSAEMLKRNAAEQELAFTDPYNQLNKFGSINTNNVALAPLSKESGQKPPIQKQHGPKWQFGVMGSAGVSRLTQSNLFDFSGWIGTGDKSVENSVAEDLSKRASTMNAPNTQGGNSLTALPPAKKAAPIRQDLAWSAGVFAQRPLGKRVRLTVGLQYTYMSVHTTIGKLVNQSAVVSQANASATVINRYYTSLDALQQGNGFSSNYTQFNPGALPADSLKGSDYTYRFHSIEIPVTVNWQINKGRVLPPFVLDAGISFGKLITTDALHYDGKKDIYYKDNSLFNKTQLNALMGFNVGLFQQSKTPVWVGPNLRYSLTGLLKKEVSSGQFLWSTGIQVKMMLKR